MNRLPGWNRWSSQTIRVRLGLALALALAPVLIVSGMQSAVTFRLEARGRRAELVGAATRSAATAQARIAGGEVLLQTLAPGSVGLQCAMRLTDVTRGIPGYLNLIRFDAIGRVACAAGSVPPDPDRRRRPWFRDLVSGTPMTLATTGAGGYADQPALLASVPARNAEGRFDGALTAVISLASLRPEHSEALPAGSEVALSDASGVLLSATSTPAFPAALGPRLAGAARGQPALWIGRARSGGERVFVSAPLVSRQVYVILSAPLQGPLTWASVNPVTALVLPLLAFALAMTLVWIVAEREIIRWIAYLQRIASIYARGRYSVHPTKAATAPLEIRNLAETLDAMAKTIAARDAVLNESLVEKDALMREIHHRVKNNLQVISSLLNMQERALTDPAARAAMSDTRQRISALALIYRSLYQGSDLRQVDLRDFLSELIALLVLSESVGGARIHTHLEADPMIVDPDRLAPLALFAVEAITNATKHGLGTCGGDLEVVSRVRGAVAEISISDSGAGGPPPRIGRGVGHTLMTAFARQLRGEATFEPNAKGGLTARLVFPTPGPLPDP